ncbi:MazG-like family protein [Streptomyces sp. MS19]|uniref:MazG-like family protein n=1 Tax=Streptomyces sp. MS19 TaxID=3385972 RepID=UPI0039A2AE1B
MEQPAGRHGNQWETVARLVAWLDAHDPTDHATSRLLRLYKIAEEAGEVAEAVQGVMGTNPRKGRSHSWADVEDEVCDVIVSAMVALASVTPDAPAVFARRLDAVARRVLDG